MEVGYRSADRVFVATLVDLSFLKFSRSMGMRKSLGFLLGTIIGSVLGFLFLGGLIYVFVRFPEFNLLIVKVNSLNALLTLSGLYFVGICMLAYNPKVVESRVHSDIRAIRSISDQNIYKKLKKSASIALLDQQSELKKVILAAPALLLMPAIIILGRQYEGTGSVLVFAHFLTGIFLETVTLGAVDYYPAREPTSSTYVVYLHLYVQVFLSLALANQIFSNARVFPGHATVVGNIFYVGRFVQNHKSLTNFEDPDLRIQLFDPQNPSAALALSGSQFKRLLEQSYEELEREFSQRISESDSAAVPREDHQDLPDKALPALVTED
ncbi:MAG: hypothetical protein RLO80_00355 [Hyphomonas sp.]